MQRAARNNAVVDRAENQCDQPEADAEAHRGERIADVRAERLLDCEGFDVQTGPPTTFRGRQVTRYLYSDSSAPDRSAKSLIGVVGGDEAGTPLISTTALGANGRANGVEDLPGLGFRSR